MKDNNPLTEAADSILIDSEATHQKPSVRSLESMDRKENPAVENRDYRRTHQANKPNCEIKIVINPRIYGTKGTGGSRLAKSAIRLAIDTGVNSPSTFEKSSIKSFRRIKTLAIASMSAEEAVKYLDDFEHQYGGKATEDFLKLRNQYKTAKDHELLELGIHTNSNGRPLYKDEATQAAYWSKMKGLSFPYYEVYLSVKPEGGRATRSQSLRVKDIDDLRNLFPKINFEFQ